MSGLQAPQTSTAFDMNAMIHAIPGFRAVDQKDDAGYLDHIPSEILAEIFQWLLHTSPPSERPSGISTMQVSHVCKRWRQVALEFPTLWVRLEMNCAHHPEVLSELISRSKQLLFSLSITLPTFCDADAPREVRAGFDQAMGLIKKNAGRLRSLRVMAKNSTFFIMLNMYFKDFTFPRLESLSLFQPDAARSMTFGTLAFNPNFFRTLRLTNLMVDCEASCLAGLRVLYLSNSKGTILEQTQMFHSTYPAIPKDPIMTHLVDLTVDDTCLVRKVPDGAPPFPPFHTSRLRTLTLARVRGSQDFLRRLFHITYHPGLQALTLDDLDDHAIAVLLNRVANSVKSPADTRVRRLVLVNLNLSLLNHSFFTAFPNVIELVLFTYKTGPIPLLSLLEDRALMPLLQRFHINNVLFQRPAIQTK